MNRPQRISDPVIEPVTLTEAAAHLRGYNSGDSSLVSGLITTARELFESHTGISLVEQTWQTTLPRFSDWIQLPKPPVRLIVSITYFDSTGQQQTLGAENYRLSLNGVLTEAYGKNYPPTEYNRIDAVTITYKTGVYTSTGASPDALDTASGTNSPSNGNPDIMTGKFKIAQQAILLMVAHLYENTGVVAPVQLYDCPMSYQHMVDSCRVEWV